jgi:hypothetical protein
MRTFFVTLWLSTMLASLAAAQTAPKGRACPAVSDNLECTSNQVCTQQRDTRDCHRAIFSSTFEDPGCLAARDSQNALYQSQYQLCQAQNARQQELCEVTREALKTAMLACKQSR